MKNDYHDKLKKIMDEYAHLVYKVSKIFPKEELYGVTSQLRRASLSIILNYIEGYSRFKKKVIVNFLETAYGSLKESKYLLNFCLKEKFMADKDYDRLLKLAEEIGAMLWTDIKKQSDKISR